jgi:hypothetical protein
MKKKTLREEPKFNYCLLTVENEHPDFFLSHSLVRTGSVFVSYGRSLGQGEEELSFT